MSTAKDLPKIDPQDLNNFRYAFAPERSPRIGIRREGQQWSTVNRGLSNDLLLQHFAGPTAYATSKLDYTKQPRTHTTVLTIDLDKDKGADTSLAVRYDRVKAIFGPAAPIVFSTPSGGYHVCYLLDKPTRRDWVISYAKKKLDDAGLKVEHGSVELLENSTLKRLPLGKGCYRLDPDTLARIGSDNIDGFYATLETLTTPFHNLLSIGPQSLIERPSRARKSTVQYGNGEAVELTTEQREYILVNGLQSVGTRRLMQAYLIDHYGRQGLRGAELNRAVIRWMDENHNGASRDWLTSRQRCINDIEYLNSTYNPQTNGRSLPDRPLYKAWIKSLNIHRPKQAKLLDFICERAWKYGDVVRGGKWIDVDIPSQSLKAVDRDYKVALGYLSKRKLVESIREAIRPTEDEKGQCVRYRLPSEGFEFQGQK